MHEHRDPVAFRSSRKEEEDTRGLPVVEEHEGAREAADTGDSPVVVMEGADGHEAAVEVVARILRSTKDTSCCRNCSEAARDAVGTACPFLPCTFPRAAR